MTEFPTITYAQWRALVERELQGKPFEKALVKDGIFPLYTEPVAVPRAIPAARIQLVMRHESPIDAAALKADEVGGANALWVDSPLSSSLPVLAGRTVSTLGAHAAGADAAIEIATALIEGMNDPASVVRVRISVGRDTFTELCKLRAMRLCWQKLCAFAKVDSQMRLHAVSSTRSISARDPWVNILRVSTQAFAAMLGGADEFTPACFDASMLARRVARNTGLILRDESMLGQVMDPAGGSYFFDALTDRLAREAWKLLQAPETIDIAAVAKDREGRIAKRSMPILGVSEFANLDEVLPFPPGSPQGDAAPFEALRLRADVLRPEAVLLDLGSRPRVGFASSFLAAGGIRTREGNESARIVCICGTDEQYADAEAVAQRLKASGVKHVVLAGKPLAAPSVDTFIFLGCDAVATLGKLLDVHS